MSITLTDDEIAAACVAMRLPWPAPLPTIEPEQNALAKAAGRGLRSLAVRASDAGSDSAVISPEIITLFATVGAASRQITTYVAKGDSPSQLAGSAAYAYLGNEDGAPAVADFVSAKGVHRFTEGSGSEVLMLISQLVKSTFDFGFNGQESEEAVLTVLGVHATASALLVKQGVIEIGRIDADASAFVSATRVTEWDASAVADALLSAAA